jgi:hypothetical protein
LSLEAIRARIDTTTHLISRWGGRAKELPAYAYWQHRTMMWFLRPECDAPGLLNPYHPEQPEAEVTQPSSTVPELGAHRIVPGN